MANKPTNPALYARVKSEAKSKFDTWPSAYGSAWLVKTYKKRGGGYRKAQDGMEVQDSINEFVNDMRMMPMGGGIMYEDYNFPMMNGGMLENRINRLENREANLVARGNKAVDEGRERRADRLLGRAAQVENRLIKARESVPIKNIMDIGNMIYGMGGSMYDDYNFPMMDGGEYGYMTYNPENQAPELPEMEQMRDGGIPPRYKNMGFNKVGVKKKSTRSGKKWMVLAKKDDKYKVVHGGYKGMRDFTQHRNEGRRDRFWNRMGGRGSARAQDPFSPLFWHRRFRTWAEGGEMDMMAQGGTNNPGFRALPEAVQAKILSNMAYGGYTNPYLMDGGEPQNAGFQALPENVQAKIMANMMYGGYLPEAAAGAVVLPLIKALAPAVIGAMGKNKQAAAQAPINIYNVTPQQSTGVQNPYMRPNEEDAYAMGGIPFLGKQRGIPFLGKQLRRFLKYEEGGTPFTAMVYFGDGGMPYYQGGGSGMGQMAMDEFEFNQMLQTPENNQETASGFDDMFRRDISYLPDMEPVDMGAVDNNKVEYIPGRSKNMYATKNFVAGLKGPKGGFNPFIAGNIGDQSFRFQASDALKPARIASTVMDVASFLGRGSKDQDALRDIQRRKFTDNMYTTMPQGVTGQRGDYDIMGNFRPDETLASRTYMGEAYMQEGGEQEQTQMMNNPVAVELELTEEQIKELIALGAEIEILN